MTHATSSQPAEPTCREISALTMNMPEPTIMPDTIITESKRPSALRNSARSVIAPRGSAACESSSVWASSGRSIVQSNQRTNAPFYVWRPDRGVSGMSRMLPIEMPIRLVIAGQLQVFQVSAQHLDGHSILMQDGIMELALGHLLCVDELMPHGTELQRSH